MILIFSLASRVTMVSDWCTKLAVFFSKPPAPKLEVHTHQLSLEYYVIYCYRSVLQ